MNPRCENCGRFTSPSRFAPKIIVAKNCDLRAIAYSNRSPGLPPYAHRYVNGCPACAAKVGGMYAVGRRGAV